MKRCHFFVAAVFVSLVLPFAASAQTKLNVVVYAAAGTHFDGLVSDLSTALNEGEIELSALPSSEIGFLPFDATLREGVADIALVPVEAAVGQEFTVSGYADLLVQPFLAGSGFGPQDLLNTEYREWVLAELGHSDLYGIGFASFGASGLATNDTLLALTDLDGASVSTPFANSDAFAALGAQAVRTPTADQIIAFQRGRDSVAELGSFDTVDEYAEAAQFLVTGFRPRVLAAMVSADNWGSKFSERERQTIVSALEAVEGSSFARADEITVFAASRFTEISGGSALPVQEILSPEAEVALRAVWEERFSDTSEAVLAAYDLAIEEASLPPPEDGGFIRDAQAPIYFVTDRQGYAESDPEFAFGVQHARDPERISCGRINWTSDQNRRRGRSYEGALTFAGARVQNDDCAQFFADAFGDGQTRVLVFIHGYRNSFTSAIGRAISIVEDTGWPHPTIVWSWPSHNEGGPGPYQYDAQHIRTSESRLEYSLGQLVEIDGVKRIDIVSHSMGGRLGVLAMKWFGREANGTLGHSVFVAPDVSDVTFEDTIRDAPRPLRTTLYASEHDRALAYSARFANDQTRAGQAGPHLIVRDGLDTIDAGPIDNELLDRNFNHTHAVELPEGLRDLTSLLMQDAEPGNRGLTEESRNGHPYWVIERDDALRQAQSGN